LKLLRFFKPAGLTSFFSSLSLVRFNSRIEFLEKTLVLIRAQGHFGAQPSCTFRESYARPFRTENNTPLIAVSQIFAPFGKLYSKAITHMYLKIYLQSANGSYLNICSHISRFEKSEVLQPHHYHGHFLFMKVLLLCKER
jgi:hypothetical protein